MGGYDVPAQIDYILHHTNQTQLNYIGHSMGNTMFYIMGSLRPEYNKKILGQISLAPVAYFKFTRSLLFRFLAPFSNIIKVRNEYIPTLKWKDRLPIFIGKLN